MHVYNIFSNADISFKWSFYDNIDECIHVKRWQATYGITNQRSQNVTREIFLASNTLSVVEVSDGEMPQSEKCNHNHNQYFYIQKSDESNLG